MESPDHTASPEELLEHAAWIQALARGLVRDPSAADDLVQETWLAALRRPRAPGEATRAWLATVMKNFARQRARSEGSREHRERVASRDESLPSPDELLAKLEKQRLLVDAVARLREPYRESVILRYYEGLSAPEIGRRLGLDAGTVRVRLQRARELLREDLDRTFGGDRRAWMTALLPLADLQTGAALGGGKAALLGGLLAMNKIVIAATLVVVVGGVYVLTRGRDPVAPVLPAAAGETAAAAPSADERDTASAEATAQRESTRAVVPVASEAATSGNRVAGRVVLPHGAPADDTLEVIALHDAKNYDAFVEGAAEKLARAAVEADGAFRVALPADAERAHLMVRGRYLYTRVSTEVEPGAEDVRLEPQVGTWLRVDVESADAASLRFRAANRGQTYTENMHRELFDVRLPVANGEAEVRAVPPGYEYELVVLPRALAADYRILDGFEPGAEKHVRVTPRPGGTVRGVVVDGGGLPVAGAAVEAVLFGVRYGVSGFVLRATSSDDEGEFELEGLPASFSLKAKRDGYIDNKLVDVEVPAAGLVDGVRLELDAGQSIAGVIRWADGTPAAGVAVGARFDESHAFGPGAFNGLRGAEGSARTDAEGRFRVTGLGAGPFIVAVSEQRDAEATGEPVSFTARADGVAPGTEGLELVLRPPLSLRGVVTTDAGAPVEDFRVRARRLVEGAVGTTVTRAVETTFNSPSGAFELTDLTGGRWRVEVWAEGYVLDDPLDVDVPVAAAEPIGFALARAATVGGIVVGPDGDPVAGARVAVDTGQSALQIEVSGLAPPETRADETGAFRFAGLPPGEVSLVASAEGFARGVARVFELEAGEAVDDAVLALRLGGTLEGMVYDADGNPTAGRIVNVFQWGLGNFDALSTSSAADGSFRFENVEPGDWNVMSMSSEADYSTDAPGANMNQMMGAMEFDSAEIREGETTYVVFGVAPTDPVRVHGEVLLGDEPYAGAVISFHPEGKGLFQARATASVDSDGRYEAELDGPGGFVVTVQTLSGKPGHQNTIEFAREVPEVEEHRLDFRVPTGRISGRVLGPDGEPAAGARITLLPDAELRTDRLFGGHYAELQTDASGAYDVPALSAGSYVVAAGGATFFDAQSPARFARVLRDGVRLGDGEWRKDVDFRLPAPCSLNVLVRDADGSPAANAAVFVRDDAGRLVEPLSVATTDAAGRATYTGLAPGRYTVSARTTSSASRSSAPVAVGSDDAGVELDLEPGTFLVVRVLGPGREPVPARLTITDEDGHRLERMFGIHDMQALMAEGGFTPTGHRVGPLPPGRVRLEARTDAGWKAAKTVSLDGGRPERKVTLRLR